MTGVMLEKTGATMRTRVHLQLFLLSLFDQCEFHKIVPNGS